MQLLSKLALFDGTGEGGVRIYYWFATPLFKATADEIPGARDFDDILRLRGGVGDLIGRDL